MEQTSASGADAEASSGATHTHTSSQAEQCDAAAAASLSPGPLTHSLGPGKVQNHTELPQQSKTCRLTAFLPVLMLALKPSLTWLNLLRERRTDCEWTSSLSFSGGGSLAGADPAEAAEAGGDPPAGRAAAVHPEPLPGSA